MRPVGMSPERALSTALNWHVRDGPPPRWAIAALESRLAQLRQEVHELLNAITAGEALIQSLREIPEEISDAD